MFENIVKQHSVDCGVCRNSDPEPNPPYFSSRVVSATFDYLTQKHSAHASSFIMLLARSQVNVATFLRMRYSLLDLFARLTDFIVFNENVYLPNKQTYKQDKINTKKSTRRQMFKLK